MDELISAVEQYLNPYVSRRLQNQLLWLPDDARSMGIHIQAGKGSGKSRLMGRLIAWQDFIRGVPLIIFDPHGPTIDNFLDKLTLMPPKIQERLWPRVLYVDMSGRFGRVIPFPLYYRIGNENLYNTSQRYLDVIRKLDPHLQTASVEGWNPLWRTGTYVGMILAALNFQITEADKLLQNPSLWARRLREVAGTYPEAEQAVSYVRELIEVRDNIRNRRTESFLNKIAMFNLDPALQAMFGSASPGVDWKQMINQHQVILLDFREEFDIERRQFKMMWVFQYFLDFVRRRGAGRHQPISLIVDELTSLFSKGALVEAGLGKDLDELINVLARNYRVWLTIAHQEQFQVTEHMQNALWTLGTQILGATSDWEAALLSAKRFLRYNPDWIKKEEVTYSGTHTVEFSIEEQALLNSYHFRDLRRYEFIVRPAYAEGSVGGSLSRIYIGDLDQGRYPNETLVRKARELLMERRGVPIDQALIEIRNRLKPIKALPRPPREASAQESPEATPQSLWSE